MPTFTVQTKVCVTVYEVEADTQAEADTFITEDSILSRFPPQYLVEVIE